MPYIYSIFILKSIEVGGLPTPTFHDETPGRGKGETVSTGDAIFGFEKILQVVINLF